MFQVDVVIVGAGAAGMMCAIEAGRRGRSVCLIDHAEAPGKKIRISGGGRCNFTNLNAGPQAFISRNPHFAKSALARYPASAFIAKVEAHRVSYHEKTLGQLFCNGSAQAIIDLLLEEMAQARVDLRLSTAAEDVAAATSGFSLALSSGARLSCQSLVIATGGKSIPKMGATDFGYRIAARFGLPVVETRPALVPLTFDDKSRAPLAELAGVSVADAELRCNGGGFREALLFTHRGLSGPAVLQISSYWREGDDIAVDLLPGRWSVEDLRRARATAGRAQLGTLLSEALPKRLTRQIVDGLGLERPLADLGDATLNRVVERLHRWTIRPQGSEGYRTAEVTLGGVDTAALDSRSMMAKAVPGLYFIGEVVDVTGWLGGYNFQWAWSSGWSAGQVA